MKKDAPLMILLDKITYFSWSAFLFGCRKFWTKKGEEIPVILLLTIFLLTIFWKKKFLHFAHDHFDSLLYPFFWKILLYVPWAFSFYVFWLGSVFGYVILIGITDYLIVQKLQKKINKVGLKNGDGTGPKLVSFRRVDENSSTLVLNSDAIGINRYEEKKNDLEAALAESIESISPGKNAQYVVLELVKRKLMPTFAFSDGVSLLQKPMTFLLGTTTRGPLTQGLETLPHMLIAGTTGGGKSVFFKQTLLGLLRTTSNLQLYLLDLKRGVEMKEFAGLPNVRLAKNEEEANFLLQNLKEEMDRRFHYLESKGFKEINPARDKMDKIVVGIDEASVLYSRPNSNSDKDYLILKARENTDELAKLARAAGIHLILATQKVTKETIDTKVQENIGGRMCFRTNTLHGSLIVLGNKMATELPDIKGRGIWLNGNNFVEVQAPYISEEEIESEIDLIKEEYDQGRKFLYQPMIKISPQIITGVTYEKKEETFP